MLGAGGMGEVYLATDTKLDRKVALKFLPESLRRDRDARDRLLREAKAASRLNHPNILTIYTVEEADGRDFIVMEHIEGVSLTKFVRQIERPLTEILDLAIQIGEGLHRAHQSGIVHRDLKPDNILVDSEGRPRILDFGLAKIEGSTRLTRTGSALGTAFYVAPEQAVGEETTPRSDIFSLGVVLYEMLGGRLPFRGEHEAAVLYAIVHEEPCPLSSVREGLPDALTHAVSRCLAKSPNERYADAAELVAELKLIRNQLRSEGAAMSQTRGQESSIAVLPFANMSADAEQEYFCDGIAEDIINNLCHINGLRVAARTSAFAFKGRNVDVREIGRQLNVKAVLEGSVRKAGKRLRITAQLINVSDGYHAWSERYDRELEDIFAIQDEIATSIAQTLQIRLNEQELGAIRKMPTRDVEAYDLYLRARVWARRGHRERKQALEMFRRAIAKDPDYAMAYAGVADVSTFTYLHLTGKQEDLDRALEFSQRALELDPSLAEAHAAHGYALSILKRCEEADHAFETAIELNPNLYEAYYHYARTCFVRGQFEKAARLYEKAAESDPEDYQALALLHNVYESLGMQDRALDATRRALKVIERHLSLNPDDSRATYFGAGALHSLGREEEALEWVERSLAMAPSDIGVLYNTACFFSRLKNIDRAIELLERAQFAGFAMRSWMEHDSDLDPLRDDPRFNQILERTGKTEA
jgi:non-specific serine/threonine protein kinase